MNRRTVAVIDIGTSSMRMALADIDDSGNIQPLEKLTQSVRIGQDVFTKGRIRRSTIEACVRTLESFQQVMREYKVDKENIRAVASSAVQEASNRETLLDRVAMATGIEIEIVDDAEATRLTYLSVLPVLQDKRRTTTEHTLVMEVGGGRTEIIELRNQNIIETRVIRLGSLRMRNQLEQQRTPQEQIPEVLDQEVSNSLHQLKDDFTEGNPALLLLGGDARFVATQFNPDWQRDNLQSVSLKRWQRITHDILQMTTEQCVEKFHLTFAEAESLGPALYTYARFAEDLGCKTLKVGAFSMRDGLLKEMAQEQGWTEIYQEQMLDSSMQLGRKFSIDEGHAKEVSGLALQLFDELKEEHHLGQRYRVLLQIAALLHEIGTFIGSTSHHKHSMYVLANSNIFGLGNRDRKVVANVARYHRRSPPKSSHPYYQSLPRRDRIVVLQLSAILRIADALARSRGRRIHKIVCERKEETFFIRIPGVDNLHLENSALRVKGKMFEQVFGMNVILVKG